MKPSPEPSPEEEQAALVCDIAAADAVRARLAPGSRDVALLDELISRLSALLSGHVVTGSLTEISSRWR